MGSTSGSVLQAGINRAIQSASAYLNPDTRDAILGPVLSRIAKGGTGKSMMEIACYADGLRIVFDTLLADGKITNTEIEVCKDYLALAAAHFAKVRSQYAGFAKLAISDIVPFLNQYRDDTGAFGYLDSSTKWSGIQACTNIGRIHGDGTVLDILRDTLLQAAKTLLMADGVVVRELDYFKKLSVEIGPNSTIGVTKPGSSQSATPLQKVIDGDYESLEKASSPPDWLVRRQEEHPISDADRIRVTCTNCGAAVRARHEQAGRSVVCMKCNGPVTVPHLQADDELLSIETPTWQIARAPLGSVIHWVLSCLSLTVALAALGVALLRDPLGSGISNYDLSTPRASLESHMKIEMKKDLRASLELNSRVQGKKQKEKLDTLKVRKEAEFQGKKILFVVFKVDGVNKYSIESFEKDANTGYWLPSYVSDFGVEKDNKELAAQMQKWEKSGELASK